MGNVVVKENGGVDLTVFEITDVKRPVVKSVEVYLAKGSEVQTSQIRSGERY